MENEFSFRTRKAELDGLEGQEFDVLVIGGGITGAGVASILAENRVRTILVDKGDFASGTSSGSSKLIHGGLRYLAQGELAEVRELLRERDYLTSHTDIVKPLKFHILVDKYSWKKYTLRFGLFLYNLLGGKFRIPRYIVNDGKYPESVRGYFEYMDSYTDDSRLVIYNIVSARRKGATCLNYLEATSFSDDGDSYTVQLKDTISGKEYNVHPFIIINAGGPWAGDLTKSLEVRLESHFRLSKGIHLVLPASRIPVKEAIAFRSSIDRRQLFVIPRGEVVHVGTTDTFVDSPEDFSIMKEDVDYILKSIAPLFPGIGERDVLTSFAGIRPLFGEGSDPGKVSRDFEIKTSGNIVNVLGGKITNYRIAARKVALSISILLGKPLETRNLPEITYSRPDDADQIEHEIYNECPLTLEDIMRRREAYRIYSPDLGKSQEQDVLEKMRRAGMLKE